VTTRRDPRDSLRDLIHLQERIGRLFEESVSRPRAEGLSLPNGAWVPLADAYEAAGTYVLQIELPGLAEEDLAVHVEGPVLTVRGQRRMTGQPECFHRMERSYGAFERSFQFPEPLDGEGMTLEWRDGLLRVEIGKARPRPGPRGRETER
jgi:HSP20 family protein